MNFNMNSNFLVERTFDGLSKLEPHEECNQHKVQVVVTPVNGREGSAEIRIMGGTTNWTDSELRRNSNYSDSHISIFSGNSSNNLTSDAVTDFLSKHPEFLENYIMKEVKIDQVERWIIRKSRRDCRSSDVEEQGERNLSLSSLRMSRSFSYPHGWKYSVHADKQEMLESLTHRLEEKPTQNHVLWELSKCICSAVGADGFKLFVVPQHPDKENLKLFAVTTSENGRLELNSTQNELIPLQVAGTKEPLRLTKDIDDDRFQIGVSGEDDVAHILGQPILQPNGELLAVLLLWRNSSREPYYKEDEEIAASYLVWGGIALHYAHLYLNMNQQKDLNDFLLIVVKSIFQDMVSMDMLILKIMNFAQRLVNADRASLFLLDSKNKELYATIFDIGVEGNIDEMDGNKKLSKNNKEIRFPLGTGIAGQVAMTGEILNIKDAYSDERFNRTVDQITGYTTKSILCMPIYIKGSIIGVVQMVNKHAGFFNENDEAAFETFAVYCGLALHHAKLYDKIKKSEQKYKVALEVLSYHNTCTDDELTSALEAGIPDDLTGLDDYYFNPFTLNDSKKVRQSISMFIDLFGLAHFDKECLVRFVLTVKKNYRKVPYHNWTHGFSVANSMYCVLKRTASRFNKNEGLALFVGALCHDLDHRGKNNKFMSDTASPLAAIYSTSTMEHHHFNQTVTILQQEGHNIFGKLSSCDYKQVLGLLKHSILATDLALFFPYKAKLTKIIEDKIFSWSNAEHRLLLQAISMTGTDLSASAKPWYIQEQTVKIIFEEFYQQGDAERDAGREPIPMMDRQQPDQQAASQVGFLNGICLPCYRLLSELIPECKPLLEMCEENLQRWKQLAESVKSSSATEGE
ncbi:probable 3',5'-cyclic phosphodiesterase pde-5 [Sitophilus oryzae]|uniref:Phosphodiesterase n=1 Tax=Sitophilus oryzae TaxID=7048 RepID=A0A6J2YET7_SITOR|nr:probable 3',5'-cyclic phosphodiesterase pde-5 [Sitophilus oryzae]